MKKNSENKVDEGFRFGPIEVARAGKTISIRNIADEEMNDKFVKELANISTEVKLEIESLVEEIRNLIVECNPLKLLNYAYNNLVKNIGGIAAECNIPTESIFIGREIEYIQSVLVSSENVHREDNDTNNFDKISEKIQQLYRDTQSYLMFYNAKLKEENGESYDEELGKFLLEAQLTMFIRGDRYQIYDILHLNELLEIHNDEFQKLYNITTCDFINGLDNIKKSLLSVENLMIGMHGEQGIQFLQFMKMFEAYEEFEKKEISDHGERDMEKLMQKFSQSESSKLYLDQMKDLEYDRFDVEKLTCWPTELIKDLSFSLGLNNDFFDGEYSGWPLNELPISKKPFIEINNKYYCFDYYNLFDNIYRVIQKLFRSKDKTYADTWISRQNETTEDMVEKLFKKLLPGCITYVSNYYPVKKSIKNCNENDLIVVYEDNLIIVEVKAGSYTYTSPIVDLQSHVNSLKTLVEKADGQAERTLKYTKSDKTVKFYNKDKSEKCELSLRDFDEVTLMCVTLDNFNEFCSKIEKVKFLKMNKNTIALSIDDLRVYSDYFESPLKFLHYLKQRKLATQNESLYLNDELDHLGMYIHHPMYSKTYEEAENAHFVANVYREELDEYFGALVNGYNEVDKPKQEMPQEFEEVITFLDNSNLKERTKLAMFLLDFSSEAKEELINMIKNSLNRQKLTKRMVQISLTGEIPLCVFLHQPEIMKMSRKEISDYTKATMINLNDKYRIELNLYYTDNDKLNDISFKFFKPSDISEEELQYIIELGKKTAKSKVESYKKRNNIKKIGRNDPCPCGSGKKYKRCHGK